MIFANVSFCIFEITCARFVSIGVFPLVAQLAKHLAHLARNLFLLAPLAAEETSRAEQPEEEGEEQGQNWNEAGCEEWRRMVRTDLPQTVGTVPTRR